MFLVNMDCYYTDFDCCETIFFFLQNTADLKKTTEVRITWMVALNPNMSAVSVG